MMDPLVQDSALEEALPPDAGGEAEFAPELDPETLAAELAELRSANENYAQRLRDTQHWGHQRDQAAQRAQAALEQVAVNTSQPQRQQPADQPWRPPQLSDEEAEAWALDPKRINNAIWQASAFAAQQATNAVRQTYEPVIQGLVGQVNSLNSQLPAAIEPAAIEAANRGASIVESTLGITREQYVNSLGAATDTLWRSSNGDMAMFNKMRTDPRIVAHAVIDVHMNSGQVAPPPRPPVPPSIGTSPRTAAPAPRPSSVPAGVSGIGDAFGIKFTPEQLREIAQAR
jgi:hypothetical protein